MLIFIILLQRTDHEDILSSYKYHFSPEGSVVSIAK